MALYRDQVLRLSLRAIRARFPPRVWSRMNTVHLEHQGVRAVVEIIRMSAPGLPSGWRSSMRCPRCRHSAEVLGCVSPDCDGEPGWACPQCARWRGRPRRIASETPVTGERAIPSRSRVWGRPGIEGV